MPQSDLEYFAQIASTAPASLRIVLTHLQQQRAYRYRCFGLASGTACFLSCIGSFTYLVATNHDKAAYTILGATVLGVVAVIVKQRL